MTGRRNANIARTRNPLSVGPAGDLSIPEEVARPWYMSGGELVPRYDKTNLQNIKIFPHQLPGQDRVPGNEMFA